MKVKYNQISKEDMSKISNGNYDVLMDSISSNNSKSFTSRKRENALTYNYYTKKAEDDNYTLCNTTSGFDDIVDEISTTYGIVPSLATLHGIDIAIDEV